VLLSRRLGLSAVPASDVLDDTNPFPRAAAVVGDLQLADVLQTQE
jgi:hypothetical protein